MSKLHSTYSVTELDVIGKSKLLGAGERKLAPGQTFGMPSLRLGPEPGVV
jgi:hypothetical protein